MTYAVRLEQFEGPLELLLQLIEKEKLDITRVSLTKVTDQYLAYLEGERSLPLSALSQFLSIAARLILLKSRALLPLLIFTEEEETSIVDLEWQLREYARYREASIGLGRLLEKGTIAYTRERSARVTRGVFFPPPDLRVQDLHAAFTTLLGTIVMAQALEETTLLPVVKLEEKMALFRQTLAARVETSFQSLTATVENRIELIVSFLALLQLIKERFVHVEQKEFFGDIAIRHKDI